MKKSDYEKLKQKGKKEVKKMKETKIEVKINKARPMYPSLMENEIDITGLTEAMVKSHIYSYVLGTKALKTITPEDGDYAKMFRMREEAINFFLSCWFFDLTGGHFDGERIIERADKLINKYDKNFGTIKYKGKTYKYVFKIDILTPEEANVYDKNTKKEDLTEEEKEEFKKQIARVEPMNQNLAQFISNVIGAEVRPYLL